MTGITITQAALRAAIYRIWDDGHDIEDGDKARQYLLDCLHVLLTLFDPAHAAPVEKGAAAPAERDAPSTTTVVARRQVSEAGTPAPPTIELPAGPGPESLTPADSQPQEGACSPIAPAPSADQAAEGRHTQHQTLRGARGDAQDTAAQRDAPGKLPWGRRPISVWTPERVAMLRERLPTCLDDAALLADLNALPAQLPVSSVGSMRKQAVKLGVQREGAVIKQLMQAGARKGLSRANEERLRLINDPPPDAPPPKARTYAMTAERLEALPALWTDPNLTAGDIQARLNELPGLRITSSTVLYGWAQKIGLSTHRPQPQDEAPPPTPPTVLHALGLPAEPTPEEQAAIADAAVLSKQDRAKDKLRQLLADKPKDISMAAAGIAAGMKLPLREVMRLMGEVRRERATA